jgi:hypothetical protein
VSPVKYELGFYIPEDDILHPIFCLRRSPMLCDLGGCNDKIKDIYIQKVRLSNPGQGTVL